MADLTVVVRDMKVKAKALRRAGKVTACLNGKEMEKPLNLAVENQELAKFMSNHNKGSKVTLSIDGKDVPALIKNFSFDAFKHAYVDIEFQQLVANEKVKSVAEVIFENDDQARGFISHNVTEIEYKALPADLVDKIIIDASAYPTNTTVTVGDLDIAKNERIDLITPAEDVVFTISEHDKVEAEPDAATEEAATETEAE